MSVLSLHIESTDSMIQWCSHSLVFAFKVGESKYDHTFLHKWDNIYLDIAIYLLNIHINNALRSFQPSIAINECILNLLAFV